MARATMSAATPAATPAIEMPVITPMTACRRFARRYRAAMNSSKRMSEVSAFSSEPSARFDYSGALLPISMVEDAGSSSETSAACRSLPPPKLFLWHSRLRMPKTQLTESAPAEGNAGRIAFTHPGFVLYQAARFFIVAALEMQSVAVGWQMYEITRRPLDLGLIGLAQFLPGMLLFLVSGHVADRFDRRKVVT